MSSVKTLLVVIAGLLLLGVVGYGSYVAATGFVPEQETTVSGGITAKQEFDAQGNPTELAVANNEPSNIGMEVDSDDNLIVSWETTKSVGTFFYLTPLKQESIIPVLNFHSGESGDQSPPIPAGRFVTTTTADKQSTFHQAIIPKDSWTSLKESDLTESGVAYFYIIVDVGDARIPYGAVKTEQQGPTQGFELNLNEF